MRTVLNPIFLLLSLTCIANSAPVSEADLKDLLAKLDKLEAELDLNMPEGWEPPCTE